MVAPRAAPPAGAFLSGQAVFHGRELLAELPLVSGLPPSRWGLALGRLGTGPAAPLVLDPGPGPTPRGLRGGGGGRTRDARLSVHTRLAVPWPCFGEGRSVRGKVGVRGFSPRGGTVREFNLGFLDELGLKGRRVSGWAGRR